jgi:hypothetical protein
MIIKLMDMLLFMIKNRDFYSKENSYGPKGTVLGWSIILKESSFSKVILKKISIVVGDTLVFTQVNTKMDFTTATGYCQLLRFIIKDIFLGESSMEKEFNLLDLK